MSACAPILLPRARRAVTRRAASLKWDIEVAETRNEFNFKKLIHIDRDDNISVFVQPVRLRRS